jgi:hypothetical protein
VRSQGGRTLQLHPQEALLQQARALQASPPFRDYRRRQVAEQAIARLVQLGIRQARYRGIPKTLFQVLMAAAAVNLTLIAGLRPALWSLWLSLLMATGAIRALQTLPSADLRPWRSRGPTIRLLDVHLVNFLKTPASRLHL